MTSEPNKPSPALEQLIGKAVADPAFRQQLMDDPEQAIQSAGLDLTDEERQALVSTSREEREQVLQELGERASPWCLISGVTLPYGGSVW